MIHRLSSLKIGPGPTMKSTRGPVLIFDGPFGDKDKRYFMKDGIRGFYLNPRTIRLVKRKGR